jgi:hypothetical protein
LLGSEPQNKDLVTGGSNLTYLDHSTIGPCATVAWPPVLTFKMLGERRCALGQEVENLEEYADKKSDEKEGDSGARSINRKFRD